MVPVQRYKWKVLLQGMLNSPTMCQHFANPQLSQLGFRFPQVLIIHYMDDILFAAETPTQVDLYQAARLLLPKYGLIIAEDKVQTQDPFLYLGAKIHKATTIPQKVQICRDTLKTLNAFQTLLGNTNWLRPALGISTYTLSSFPNISQ